MGDRLQIQGKARVTVTGTLTDGKSERQIVYSWQFPGQFRIEAANGGLIQFNGDRLNINAAAFQANDSAALSTLSSATKSKRFFGRSPNREAFDSWAANFGWTMERRRTTLVLS